MLELIGGDRGAWAGSTLRFTFPEICPEAKLDVTFQRTLRIPDDSKEYPLPPGLGNFPMRHVDDFKDRVPGKWLERGGVMLPMYQSEALWIQFTTHAIHNRRSPYLFAVKVATGKRSALTGKKWSVQLREKDYCIVPPQPWLDGYVVEEGVIRQFVAMPLGQGFTAEEQLDGKAEHGGIQIEVIPMRLDLFNRKFPVRREVRTRGGILRGQSFSLCDEETMDFMPQSYSCNSIPCAAAAPDMGIGAGGKMKQQVFEDEHGLDAWDMANRSRAFVHIANSLAWKAITRHDPPTAPQTAALYSRYGYPWYDYYEDDWKSLKGTGKLKGLKSILELGFQKGLVGVLPENESAPVRSDQIRVVKNPQAVRDGNWG